MIARITKADNALVANAIRTENLSSQSDGVNKLFTVINQFHKIIYVQSNGIEFHEGRDYEVINDTQFKFFYYVTRPNQDITVGYIKK